MRAPRTLRAFLIVAACCLTPVAATAGRNSQRESRENVKSAKSAFGLGRYDEAARLYEKAYEASPDSSILYNAAQAHRLGGNKQRAIELYRNLLRLHPQGELTTLAKQQLDELERSTAPAPPPTTPPAVPPAAPPSTTPPAARPSLAPPPAVPAGAGGAACAGPAAQFAFETATGGADVAHGIGRSFTLPAIDATRSWCGGSSLRVQVTFGLDSTRTAGVYPTQLGELYLPLPAKSDLTNRTVTAHLFVTGPAGFSFGGQVLAARGARWIDGTPYVNQPTGKWVTFTHTFRADNRLYAGGTSKADDIEAVVVQIWAFGSKPQRTWTGTAHIDEVTIR